MEVARVGLPAREKVAKRSGRNGRPLEVCSDEGQPLFAFTFLSYFVFLLFLPLSASLCSTTELFGNDLVTGSVGMLGFGFCLVLPAQPEW